MGLSPLLRQGSCHLLCHLPPITPPLPVLDRDIGSVPYGNVTDDDGDVGLDAVPEAVPEARHAD